MGGKEQEATVYQTSKSQAVLLRQRSWAPFSTGVLTDSKASPDAKINPQFHPGHVNRDPWLSSKTQQRFSECIGIPSPALQQTERTRRTFLLPFRYGSKKNHYRICVLSCALDPSNTRKAKNCMGKEILFLNSFIKTNHQAKDDCSEEHFLKESVGDHC